MGYQFRDPELLELALRHRSVGARSNERLEFLGDSILNLLVSQRLYRLFPDANEGRLSRLRASLVCGNALAEIAVGMSLGEQLQLGAGELKSGGHHRSSILADAVEAILGAVFLDGGVEPADAAVTRLYAEHWNRLLDRATHKDPKTRLQEWLQARKMPLPEYHLTKTSGPDHEQHFTVQCQLTGRPALSATGSSRKRAEQEAAERTLATLTIEHAAEQA